MEKIAWPTMLVALLLLGCSDESKQGSEPDESSSAQASKAAPSEPAKPQNDSSGSKDGDPDDEPAPQADGGGSELPMLLKESQLHGNVPTDKSTVLDAEMDGTQLAIVLEHLNTACGPVPDFRPQLSDGELTLQLQAPEDASHCVGPHTVKLRIKRQNIDHVRLLDAAGNALASDDVTQGK